MRRWLNVRHTICWSPRILLITMTATTTMTMSVSLGTLSAKFSGDTVGLAIDSDRTPLLSILSFFPPTLFSFRFAFWSCCSYQSLYLSSLLGLACWTCTIPHDQRLDWLLQSGVAWGYSSHLLIWCNHVGSMPWHTAMHGNLSRNLCTWALIAVGVNMYLPYHR